MPPERTPAGLNGTNFSERIYGGAAVSERGDNARPGVLCAAHRPGFYRREAARTISSRLLRARTAGSPEILGLARNLRARGKLTASISYFDIAMHRHDTERRTDRLNLFNGAILGMLAGAFGLGLIAAAAVVYFQAA